ncbi:uncharacterized protein [Rutidosis leptorrhynchoides]|uniref:uncharacterized protein n=1 Tax=Rutidosis leptorrhynchoides TaxID=125765 RepID=UPI003A998F2B
MVERKTCTVKQTNIWKDFIEAHRKLSVLTIGYCEDILGFYNRVLNHVIFTTSKVILGKLPLAQLAMRGVTCGNVVQLTLCNGQPIRIDTDTYNSLQGTHSQGKVSNVIWYQVLNEVNIVSKKLQSKDMHLEIAIKEINRLVEYFKDYRETSFSKVIDEAKEIAVKMDVSPVFSQKRLIQRKKRFDESSSSQEVSFTPQETFRVQYFLYIVDKAILSLETRFEQIKNYDKLFDLKSFCGNLKNALKYKRKSNINGHELYRELKSFNIIGASEFKNPLDILMHLNESQENFPNARIAYRILLIIPVTVASAERSFSKLKLMKIYLRSTMSRQRLSGLAMMAIENEILESINCEALIKQFATKNARRASKTIG